MMSEQSDLAAALTEDPEICAALAEAGMAHGNARALADGYLQFLRQAETGGPHPSIAVRAFWRAHRASSGFAAFAAAHPDRAPVPPEDAFTAHRPRDYAKLYATVAMEEDFIDDSVWPEPKPPRALGLTNREATWLYALVLAISAWLVYEVSAGVLGWPLLLVVPLFAAFAVARFYVGRVYETVIPLSSRHYAEALDEVGNAWPVQAYAAADTRKRRVVLGWFRPRTA